MAQMDVASMEADRARLARDAAVRHEAAVRLQAFVRGDKAQMEFLLGKAAAIQLQAWLRGSMLRRKIAEADCQAQREADAALALQSWWRGTSCRREVLAETQLELAELEAAASVREKAAVVMQSNPLFNIGGTIATSSPICA